MTEKKEINNIEDVRGGSTSVPVVHKDDDVVAGDNVIGAIVVDDPEPYPGGSGGGGGSRHCPSNAIVVAN